MDYISLQRILPKEPKKWTIQEVQTWLQFIGLQQLQNTFSQNSIDGSCLNLLEENDLIEDLEIKSNIVRKKLMHWLKNGLREYNEHLNTSNKIDEEVPINLEQTEIVQCLVSQNLKQEMMTSYIRNPLVEIENKQKIQQELTQDIRKVQNELIISSTEGPQSSFYSIKETGGKIGRHSSNQVLILEESISRFHAEINFQDQDFYIKDIGSTTGTFIKIEKSLELKVGMIIEFGSNQFQVQLLNSNGDDVHMILRIIEGPNQHQIFELQFNMFKSIWKIGRKSTVDLFFGEDHHLSNIHSKIFNIEGKVYVEDMGSTNGSWLRLSSEGKTSELFQLETGTIFKVGTTSTFQCRKTQDFYIEKPNENLCIICIENERDSLYLPCKHNTACLKCSKNLKDCPICRTKIQDVIRIYKN